jgi:two-component system LytT family response regulator
LRGFESYKFTPIVFITGVPTKEMEAFHRIHCYDYILKPLSRKTLSKVMTNILVDYFRQPAKTKERYLVLDFKGIRQKINMDEIIYLERRNRKIVIVTRFEEIVYKSIPIKGFIDFLDDMFIQIHQSFIVNKKHVKRVDLVEKTISISGNAILIPIGVSYKKMAGELINGNI